MKFSEILSTDDIIIELRANSKKQVLQEMANRIASSIDGLDARVVFDNLMERERLGCTSIGGGIAIPHSRCPFPDTIGAKPITLLSVLSQPIDFQSNDDQLVDIVFMLIAPENIGGEHLTALALASRILRNNDVANNLRGCSSVEAAWSLLSSSDISNAA